MELTDNDIRVIEALAKESPILTLDALSHATRLDTEDVERALKRLIQMGVICETNAQEIVRIENEEKIAFVCVFRKAKRDMDY